MRKLTIGLLCMMIMHFAGFSQNNKDYSVTGSLKSDVPVDYFNVAVLNAKDSSFIKGAIFYTPKFEIADISASKIILSFSSVGFTSKMVAINNVSGQKVVNYGVVEVEGLKLKEVTVKANKSIIHSSSGGSTTLNIINSPLASSGTVVDILKKSPGVLVDKDNSVTVFGKGTAKLYLNGREITNANEISDISSEQVSKVEIVKNPSSKYDASANAVINIVTKSKFREGYNVKASLATTYGEYLRAKADLDLSFHRKAYDLYTFVTTNKQKIKYIDEYFRTIPSAKDTVYMQNRLEKKANNQFPTYFTIGTNYRFSSKHQVGISYTGNFVDNDAETSNVNKVGSSSDQYLFNTKTGSTNHVNNNQISTKYLYNIDSSRHQLNLTFDYLNYHRKALDEIAESISNGKTTSYEKHNFNTNNYQFLSGLADYTRPLGSEKHILSVGVKGTYIESKSNTVFEINNGSWSVVPDKSVYAKYNEIDYAAYSMIEGHFEKLSLSAGLRGEYTRMDNKTDLVRTYKKFYPSASVGYTLSKDVEASLTFSSRYKRPGLADLNPSLTYIDSLSYYKGNPSLKPEQIQSFDLGVSYKKFASLSVSYVHKDDPMLMYVESHPELNNVTYVSVMNFKKSDKFSVVLNLPYDTKFWTIYNSFGAEYNKIEYNSNSSNIKLLNNSKTLYYAYIYNNFKITKTLGFYVTYQFNSSGINGIFEYNLRHILTTGLTKQLAGGWNLHLMYNDIFKTDNQKTTAILPTLKLKYNSFYDASYVRLIVTYNFGKDFKVGKIKSGLKDDLNRIKEN